VPVRGAIHAALLHRGKLVFIHALGVVQQPPDERGFAVVDRAGGGKAQHLLAQVRFEKLLEGVRTGVVLFKRSRPCGCSLEVALPLLHFHRTFFVVIDRAVLALAAAERNEFLDDLRQRVRFAADGAGAGRAAEGAHADH
jgi:hypothetical protein